MSALLPPETENLAKQGDPARNMSPSPRHYRSRRRLNRVQSGGKIRNAKLEIRNGGVIPYVIANVVKQSQSIKNSVWLSLQFRTVVTATADNSCVKAQP